MSRWSQVQSFKTCNVMESLRNRPVPTCAAAKVDLGKVDAEGFGLNKV